jgi:hypothetical protein
MYPQEVFGHMRIPGVDINAAANGLMLPGKDHIGKGGVHPSGWNPEWQDWVDKQKKAGKPITKASMEKQLEVMKKSPKYAAALQGAKVQPAKMSFGAWRIYLKKRAALKAAKLAQKAVAKAAGGIVRRIGVKVPIIGIGLGLFFWRQDVQAKGAAGGTANTILDATPGVGIIKGVGEAVTGKELIPDQDPDEMITDAEDAELMRQAEREDLAEQERRARMEQIAKDFLRDHGNPLLLCNRCLRWNSCFPTSRHIKNGLRRLALQPAKKPVHRSQNHLPSNGSGGLGPRSKRCVFPAPLHRRKPTSCFAGRIRENKTWMRCWQHFYREIPNDIG